MKLVLTLLTAVLALMSLAYAADPPHKNGSESASVNAPVARSSAEAEAMRAYIQSA